MSDHPALTWLRSHPRLVAVLGSLLISAYFLARGDAPNDDAYTYVRVADVLLHNGVGAAFQHYPWATYPVLFAHFALFGVDLFTAGLVFNALLFALLAGCFVSLVAELVRGWPQGQRDSALLLAVLVVLLYPQLNEFRTLLIRDVGFWAFSLLGLLQLIRATRQPSKPALFWRHALGFCAALGAAFLFRAEALAYIILAPALFVFLVDGSGRRRFRDALKLSALVFACAALALGTTLAAGIDLAALFVEFLASYSPFIEAIFAPDEAQRSLFSSAVFGEYAEIYSGEYVTLFLVGGLLAILGASLASAISLPYLVALGLAAVGSRQDSQVRSDPTRQSALSANGDALVIVLGFVAINLALLLGFILITRFVSARYGMLLSLLAVTALPVLLARALRPPRDSVLAASGPLARRLIAFLFLYCFVDSFYSFGDRKTYLEEASQWMNSNDSAAPLLSNSRALAFASNRIENYDKAQRYLSLREMRGTTAGTLLVIDLNARMTERLDALVAEGQLQKLAGFPASAPRVEIFRRL